MIISEIEVHVKNSDIDANTCGVALDGKHFRIVTPAHSGSHNLS
jgi:hypothetical protein